MSHSVLVKFCGFQDADSIAGLIGLDVNMAGFILAPSKRRVSLDRLKELTRAVPVGIKKVGVFVNPSLEEITATVEQGQLDVVQLHGEESPEFCKQVKKTLGVEIIKAWHIGRLPDDEALSRMEQYKEGMDYLLLDTYDPSEAGGTGKAFRWDILPVFHKWCTQQNIPLMVAGGIKVDNVLQLLSGWQLHGIDVSSGIETEGLKDKKKMKDIIERVRGNVRT
jgi:phosphoribosylanthranilate isomerase